MILLIAISVSSSGAITTTSIRFTKENRLVLLEYGVLVPLKVLPGVLVSRLRGSSLITSSPKSNYYVRTLVIRTIKVALYINRIKSSKISSRINLVKSFIARILPKFGYLISSLFILP